MNDAIEANMVVNYAIETVIHPCSAPVGALVCVFVCAAFSTLNLYGDTHRHGHGLANTCVNARQKRWYACNGQSMWHRHKNKIEHHHTRSRRHYREISIHIIYNFIFVSLHFLLWWCCHFFRICWSTYRLTCACSLAIRKCLQYLAREYESSMLLWRRLW